MKEYIRRYFMLRRHNMKVAIKKAKMSKMCYAFLAPYAIIFALFYISSIIDMIFPVSYKKHALRKKGAPYVFFPHTERLFPPFFSGPGYSYTNWFVFSSYS